VQVEQQVEQRRVDRADIAGAEIAQQRVDRDQRIGHVLAGGAVLDGEAFPGVEMGELESA
jgi:hypothetical protein